MRLYPKVIEKALACKHPLSQLNEARPNAQIMLRLGNMRRIGNVVGHDIFVSLLVTTSCRSSANNENDGNNLNGTGFLTDNWWRRKPLRTANRPQPNRSAFRPFKPLSG